VSPSRRVLVYGTYPPATGPAANATLAAVRALLAEGADVEVVSPWPSAAHHHAHVDGLRGNLRFAAHLARSRPDEIVAHLDPTLLRPRRAGRAEPIARRVLGRALRGATVHLPPLAGRLDPAYVGWVFGSVAGVVADSPADADALVAAGVDRARVSARVPSDPETVAPAPARQPWPAFEPVTREALEAEVRRRAAADRGAAPVDGPEPLTASRPLDRIPPYGDPPTWSPRPMARLVKRLVWRVTRWEVEPLVDHVNLVHRAAAAEAAGAAPGLQPPASGLARGGLGGQPE
jgi:hypothetical protein